MNTENFKVQAKLLSNRYGMPLATVRKWMTVNDIHGLKDWMASYGSLKYASNTDGHDACLSDITNWILS